MAESYPIKPEERVFERQRRMRFDDLDEFFFARLLLNLVDDPCADRTVTINFNLNNIFTQYDSPEAAEAAANTEFEDAGRLAEILIGMEDLLPSNMQPKPIRILASEHYATVLRRVLGYLRSGDSVALPPTIDDFAELAPARFSVTFSTAKLRRCLHENLGKRLSLRGDFINKIQKLLPDVGARIDYRKELDLLQQFLDARQAITGEVEFSFTTAEVPFRHAVAILPGGVAMPAPGTSGPDDRTLLPLYLEACGLLDITYAGLCSSPTDPLKVVVKYSVRRPAQKNIFNVACEGLSSEERRRLSEVEISIYHRVHRQLQNRYVFLSRPNLERSFAVLAAWLIRKVAFALEAPSFIAKPALAWIEVSV